MGLLRELANVLDVILDIYLWIVFIAVILSWIPLSPYNPTAQTIMRILHRATEPVFDFFRRTFKLHRYTSPIDITPMVVILTIYFLRIFVVQTLRDMALVNNFFQAIFYTVHFVLNIYFWIVVIATFFILMSRFYPYHALARVRIPFIQNITEPVFEFLRQLFRSRLQVHFHNFPQPLDLAPILVIVIIYLLQIFLVQLAAVF